jgi:hypothetical protein
MGNCLLAKILMLNYVRAPIVEIYHTDNIFTFPVRFRKLTAALF